MDCVHSIWGTLWCVKSLALVDIVAHWVLRDFMQCNEEIGTTLGSVMHKVYSFQLSSLLVYYAAQVCFAAFVCQFPSSMHIILIHLHQLRVVFVFFHLYCNLQLPRLHPPKVSCPSVWVPSANKLFPCGDTRRCEECQKSWKVTLNTARWAGWPLIHFLRGFFRCWPTVPVQSIWKYFTFISCLVCLFLPVGGGSWNDGIFLSGPPPPPPPIP